MSGEKQLVAVLGQGVVPTDTGVVSADDAGLVRGDGCFDATLVERAGQGFKIWDLEAHLDRFARSCQALELPLPDQVAWKQLIQTSVQAWDGGDAALKLVATRGPEHGGEPSCFLTLTEVGPAVMAQRQGISVITLNRGYPADAFAGCDWLLGGVKTLSYAINAAAKRQATKLGADDVVFTSSDGFILEAPTASIIWRQDDVLYSTPHGPTGILASISQAKIFAGAPTVGLKGEFALGSPADIEASEGAWLVSSVRGLAPILTFDGVALANDEQMSAKLRGLNGF